MPTEPIACFKVNHPRCKAPTFEYCLLEGQRADHGDPPHGISGETGKKIKHSNKKRQLVRSCLLP
jgi:hypothetical protein